MLYTVYCHVSCHIKLLDNCMKAEAKAGADLDTIAGLKIIISARASKKKKRFE